MAIDIDWNVSCYGRPRFVKYIQLDNVWWMIRHLYILQITNDACGMQPRVLNANLPSTNVSNQFVVPVNQYYKYILAYSQNALMQV